MSGSNILVSNGTCYSAAGEKLDGNFIPCGNAAFGHRACCGAGDNCLSNNACFGIHGSGYGSLLTYMAGCSDPDYKDSSCPNKHIDQPWVALTLCDNSDGAWAVCSQEGNPSTLRPGSFCTCTNAASATVAFKDATVLASSASLPQSTGQSIGFFAGYVPTPPPGGGNSGPSPTSGNESPNQPGTTNPSRSGAGSNSGGASSPNQTSTPPGGEEGAGSGSSGLGSGAKIGIGVGVALGALLILAAILLLLRRRKRRRDGSEIESGSAHDAKNAQRISGVSTTPTVSEADSRPARPWSMRSELEGSHVPPQMAELDSASKVAPVPVAQGGYAKKTGGLSPVAELPGSEAWRVGSRGVENR